MDAGSVMGAGVTIPATNIPMQLVIGFSFGGAHSKGCTGMRWIIFFLGDTRFHRHFVIQETCEHGSRHLPLPSQEAGRAIRGTMHPIGPHLGGMDVDD